MVVGPDVDTHICTHTYIHTRVHTEIHILIQARCSTALLWPWQADALPILLFGNERKPVSWQ